MTQDNKPRLVPTGSGFSILYTVEYNNRFLYSKYSPSRAILSLIEKTQILPGTLVIINSPCLFYGLAELLKKSPENCIFLAIENDENLFELAQDSLKKITEENPETNFSSVHLFSTKNLLALDDFLRTNINTGTLRRTLPIDFSAGKVFSPQIYDTVSAAAQEIIATFWKNRITLVKMGRLFSKNIFKNLKSLDKGILLNQMKNKIEKPILVCGAGESLDCTTADDGTEFSKALRRGDFFVLAVDASFTTLLDRGISVDGVIGLESQFAIQKAYIGHDNRRPLFFADLCSRPQVQRIFMNDTIWFSSEFAELKYLNKIKKIVPDFIPPLGSVGLAALYVALEIRKKDATPIYVTGLDFSYSVGKTHANYTPAHKAKLFSTNKTCSVENIDAAFSSSTAIVPDKTQKPVATSAIMMSYRNNFENSFSRFKNIYDIGESGLPLGIKRLNKTEIKLAHISEKPIQVQDFMKEKNFSKEFLDEEKNSLLILRDLLSKGEKSEHYSEDSTLSSQIRNLLSDREYLYLHFPDGYQLSMEPGFLKRVRAEIDFFLKII